MLSIKSQTTLLQTIEKIKLRINQIEFINLSLKDDLDDKTTKIYSVVEVLENLLSILCDKLRTIKSAEHYLLPDLNKRLTYLESLTTSYNITLKNMKEALDLSKEPYSPPKKDPDIQFMPLPPFKACMNSRDSIQPVPAKSYYAETNNGILNFIKQPIPKNDNCAISLFGCTRKEMSETILAYASDPSTREKYYSIIAAAVELENWPYQIDYHQIKNNFYSCQQDYDQYNLGLLEKHNEYFELDLYAKNPEEDRKIRDQVFLDMLKIKCSKATGNEKQDLQDDIDQLIAKKEALEQAQQAHKEFYTREEIFIAYATYLSEDKVSIDIETMAIYAENNNICLFIWQEVPSEKGGLLTEKCPPRVSMLGATRTLHTLYGNGEHFDALEEVSPSLQSEARPIFSSSSTVFKTPSSKPSSQLNPHAKPFYPMGGSYNSTK